MEKRIRFTKMTGSGNDFIVIDNRSGAIEADRFHEVVRLACRRKLSVGADGLILIENDPEVAFRWRFFNADGSEADMCGNGSRCACRFARLKGVVTQDTFSFRTGAGILAAQILGERVKIQMTTPHSMEIDFCLPIDERTYCVHFVNTGVPHAVCFVENEEALESTDVFTLGRLLRYHPRFQPAGSNVNFALVRDANHIAVRTYERGVEDETLACGTGSIASALIAAAKQQVRSPVAVQTRSGETLTIHFQSRQEPGQGPLRFSDVFLEGDAKIVYEAELWDETLRA